MTRAVIAVALGAAGIAYPFAVHAGLQHGAARWIALPLAVLWLARAMSDEGRGMGGRLVPAAAVAFCAAIAFLDDSRLLRWYPVLINAGMAAVFARSLLHGMPVIERLARLRRPDLPAAGVAYTRRVTQVWTAFFVCNGSVAAALALWAPWIWWTWYNGAISYALIGLLIVGEWICRPGRHTGEVMR
ncbi:hypothetical protein [Bordetella genomosp. 9]|uniref:DNA gyrase subunit B n=1 Tax=Bordetella genomosp. 9 TaxID=1416803 RepID=A0A1W6Z1T1_9BORD|nr:hypothetical protein [Bordetella genomosp. 9]ARP87059.1 hypothetical protein CAL13_13200 [Bordetella genomosp. 9]ARP91046.1 hypothetical protein CAL14_12725 [Bordetella genomosp. 9]